MYVRASYIRALRLWFPRRILALREEEEEPPVTKRQYVINIRMVVLLSFLEDRQLQVHFMIFHEVFI